MPRKSNKLTNLTDIDKMLGGSQGAAYLMSQAVLRKELQEAGELLKSLVEKHIRAYYDSYDPVSDNYTRTYALLNSVRLDPVKQQGGQLVVKVYIDPAQATHPSIMGGEPGMVGVLIDQGWSWSTPSNPPVQHFQVYEGYHFMEKAIKDFNKQNKFGFTIEQHVR